jgi:hypothetical protein
MRDGGENASTEFGREQIRLMIEHQIEAYNWKFVFIGANQDSFASAGSIGIKPSGTMNYAVTSRGVRQAFRTFSDGVSTFRETAGLAEVITEADREKQREAGARH